MQNYTIPPWVRSKLDGGFALDCAFLLDENNWGQMVCGSPTNTCMSRARTKLRVILNSEVSALTLQLIVTTSQSSTRWTAENWSSMGTRICSDLSPCDSVLPKHLHMIWHPKLVFCSSLLDSWHLLALSPLQTPWQKQEYLRPPSE